MVFNSNSGGYSFDRGGGSSSMVITSAGNVGIGVANPSQSLEVSGSVSLNNGGVIYGSDSGSGNNLQLNAAPSVDNGAAIALTGRTASGAGKISYYAATNLNDTTMVHQFIKEVAAGPIPILPALR